MTAYLNAIYGEVYGTGNQKLKTQQAQELGLYYQPGQKEDMFTSQQVSWVKNSQVLHDKHIDNGRQQSTGTQPKFETMNQFPSW